MQKVIVILGPTAVGKSSLGVSLARAYRGEVISADSRQVYAGLDIGTGKITKKERQGVLHHLLDIASPKKQISVATYQRLARKKLDEIEARGSVPMIVGGTGLYIESVVNDVSLPEVPPNVRLRKKLEKKSTTELFVMLKKLDPKRAETIDASNPRRLVRAIEIATVLGRVPPYQNTPRMDIDPLFIGLTIPFNILRKRIASRLLIRLKGGMVAEAQRLHAEGLSWKRMETLGLEYRYLSRYLRGLLTKDEMIKKLQSEIVRYAKRQMTWFKRDKRIVWFKPTEKRAIQKKVREFLCL